MAPRGSSAYFRSRWATVVAFAGLMAAVGCSDDRSDGDACLPNDQDGVIGGEISVVLTVSDSAFAVGGVDSGSTQRNITIQNSSQVTLKLTNTGSQPHSFMVECIPSELPAECPQISCFPAEADIAAVEPGQSVTTEFTVPVVEGAYPFSSDVAGDEALVGQFVVN